MFSTYSLSRGLDLSFAGALLHIYGIWIVVHLWDGALARGSVTFDRGESFQK